ncbi:hypothetical protein ACFHYQ_06080 [Sphaerimonospora cavernae]|uniref:TetR family transcriptional regulator n=1 Tax=Sphaerimonospora cavernae TaxID=1740611 RepID=A0ABV6U072_9ACTN
MGIAEVAADVEAHGTVCYTLGTLKRAFLADHPELDQKKNSKLLMSRIREALEARNILVVPEQLDSLEEARTVFVIFRTSPLGWVLHRLNREPDAAAATLLASLEYNQEKIIAGAESRVR